MPVRSFSIRAGAGSASRQRGWATRIEIGYFLTRPGHGDELRYRSTLRGAFTLTTAGTRTTLAGAVAEHAFAYRRPRPGAPARLVDERTGQRVRTFRYAAVRRPALTVSGSEHLGLPESVPQLDSIDRCLGWFGGGRARCRSPPRSPLLSCGRRAHGQP